MLPFFRLSSLFRNKWIALAWVGFVCWQIAGMFEHTPTNAAETDAVTPQQRAEAQMLMAKLQGKAP